MKKYTKITFLSLIVILLSGCFLSNNKIEKEINFQLENMTLREKIGQMLIVYNTTTTYLNEEFKNELIENQVGGYIIFDNNITTYNDTKKFIEEVKNSVEIPMFIAVDQEGGKVQRLLSVTDKNATNIPDMQIIGEYNNPNLSYNVGIVIGEESRSLGINTVFGPVIDVGNYETSTLKKRLISDNPKIVSKNAIKIAQGICDTGVIPVYKHFPGIADTTIDSHADLPVIYKTIDNLKQVELIPFIEAINNNDVKTYMIMVGHANYPLITNDKLPSSLSKKIINDLLRKQLGYDGVVITDAINMDALRDNYSEEMIFELGINASVDIFLMPDNSKIAIDIIENLVNDGKVSIEQINESVKRILKLKQHLENFLSLDESYFGSNEHKNLLKAVN